MDAALVIIMYYLKVILLSYYNLSSVTLVVCALTTQTFTDLRANLAGRSTRPLSEEAFLDFMRESQGGSPIGKALV